MLLFKELKKKKKEKKENNRLALDRVKSPRG